MEKNKITVEKSKRIEKERKEYEEYVKKYKKENGIPEDEEIAIADWKGLMGEKH